MASRMASAYDNDVWKRFGDYWMKQNVEETTRDSLFITLAYEEKKEENPEYCIVFH
jgi:hypothetical protein